MPTGGRAQSEKIKNIVRQSLLIPKKGNNITMYKTLSEAADYTGFTKPAFTHLFYNKFNKQKPTPSYINEGDTKTVTKNINGIDRRIKYKGMLRFHQDDLDAFLEEFRGNDS